jgi:hypothetical protein
MGFVLVNRFTDHLQVGTTNDYSPIADFHTTHHFTLKSSQSVSTSLYLIINSVVLVRKRTIPTERPQPAGEVSANFS